MDRFFRSSRNPLFLLTAGSFAFLALAVLFRTAPRETTAPTLSPTGKIESGDQFSAGRYPPAKLALPAEVRPISFDFDPHGVDEPNKRELWRLPPTGSTESHAKSVLSPGDSPAERGGSPAEAPSEPVDDLSIDMPINHPAQPTPTVSAPADEVAPGDWLDLSDVRQPSVEPPLSSLAQESEKTPSDLGDAPPNFDAASAESMHTITRLPGVAPQANPTPPVSVPANTKPTSMHFSSVAEPQMTVLDRNSAPRDFEFEPPAQDNETPRLVVLPDDLPGPDPQMMAVSRIADGHVRRGTSLATRNALYLARREFTLALRVIAEALDIKNPNQETTHTQHLVRGLRALREADDFVLDDDLLWQEQGDVELIVRTHHTPVLHDADLQDLAPWIARQRYYTFAQEEIAQACGHEPAASRALFSLGKLQMIIAQQEDERLAVAGPQAMVFHQAALTVDSRNYRAANELGVLLARFSQFEDARRVLLHALTTSEQAEAWYNLSLVHQQLGEVDLARRAHNEWQLAREKQGRDGSRAAAEGMVQWVDSQTFARLSPGPGNLPAASIRSTPMSAQNKPEKKPWWNPWQ